MRSPNYLLRMLRAFRVPIPIQDGVSLQPVVCRGLSLPSTSRDLGSPKGHLVSLLLELTRLQLLYSAW